MNKAYVFSILIALLVLMSAIPVYADEADIYYVRLDHTGCEDGSEECPYNTLNEAISKGHEQVCEGRTFEVHLWNSDALQYEYHDTYTGQKPIPPMGLPIASSLLILLIAIGGLSLLVLALRLRSKSVE